LDPFHFLVDTDETETFSAQSIKIKKGLISLFLGQQESALVRKTAPA